MAITRPPRAGPTARAILNPAEFNATAAASLVGGTRSGVSDCQAGSFITAPTPSKKVNTRRISGVTVRVRVITPSTLAAAIGADIEIADTVVGVREYGNLDG